MTGSTMSKFKNSKYETAGMLELVLCQCGVQSQCGLDNSYSRKKERICVLI